MSNSNYNARAWIVRILFSVLAVILIVRLFTMQVLDEKYEMMAADQAILRKVIYPARGIITDRKGKSLLSNQVTFDLGVTPAKVKDLDTMLLCDVLSISKKEFEDRFKKVTIRNGPLRMSIFESFLSEEKNARLQENIYTFEGFELIERTTRTYPLKIGAHFLGYLNEVNKNMLETERYASYRRGDYVGISGLENVYEEVLRGQRGVQYMVRDVMNRPQDSYKNGAMDTLPIAGKNLELYLDAELQAYGEKLFQGKIGSVIAIDPKTGGILAMVSAPSFDPNLLSGGSFGKNYSELYKNPIRPLFNRTVQAQYSPGSTFKPVTALVALDVGVITPSFGITCPGGYYGCGKRIRCTHSDAGHSSNLTRALANSCNSYFCHIFRMIVDSKQWPGGKREGIQVWHDYLYSFGLGHALGVDITGEYKGSIPDLSYFDRVYNNHWNSCNMVVMGMGQGEVDMTPMQMANVMAMIANRGYYYTPHLVKAIDGNPRDSLLAPYLEKKEVTHIPDQNFQAVIDGMESVIQSGTGRVAQLPGIRVGGKTGTVENYAVMDGQRMKLDDHSVFVCFAPVDDPKIAIAVVVQNAGFGSTWAGPIASLMMEKYLTDTVKRIPLQEKMFNTNTVKKYIYTLDSLQREKDLMRELLRNADIETKLRIKRQRDTTLVQQILENYYNIKVE